MSDEVATVVSGTFRRRAPRKKKTDGLAYPGPFLPEILALSDEEVEQAYEQNHFEKPRTLKRFYDTEDYSPPTPEQIEQYDKKYDERDRRVLRIKLFSRFINAWVESLSEAELWKIVAKFEGEDPSESEIRYTSLSRLRNWASSATFATHYQQPT